MNPPPVYLYRKKILFFFSIMQLLLLGVVISSILIYKNREIHQESVADSYKMMDVFQSDIAHEKSILQGLLPIVKNDPSIQEAWLARDRPALLKSSEVMLEYFRQQFRVTHFYFHDIDSVNFLRVHAPERHGDLIKRFTLTKAKQKNEDYGGLELGPLGTFALRFVSPWVIDSQLTGYIELGMEIDHITQHLEERHDMGFVIIIRKSFLNQQNWETGQQIFSLGGSWDRYKKFAVTEIRNAPLPLTLILNKKQPDHNGPFVQVFKSDGNRICSVFHPLKDAGDREVGYIIIVNDYTDELESLMQLLLLLSIVFVIVCTILLVVLNFILVRLESARLKAEEKQALLFTQLETAKSEIEYNRDQLQDALDSISELMEEITEKGILSVRYENQILEKCYVKQKCTQENCPCYGKEPMRCWQIAGTFCGGEVQGAFVDKFKKCQSCVVFKSVAANPVNLIGEHFNNMMYLLELKHKELLKALSEIRTLRGYIPICATCKKIRDDKGYWNQIENYIRDHSEAEFSHSICPECEKKYYDELNEILKK